MGGIRWDYRSLAAMSSTNGTWFVVPGGDDSPLRDGNLIRLPFRSDFYHPDLVHAADLVVGKLGYSTVAEVYHARTALAYLPRPQFAESDVLERFAISRMGATAVAVDDFNSGAWLEGLDGLLGVPRRTDHRENGAEEAARIILEYV
jgi:UDP-N-acetylglucosamine:LPS N-acetylglucosamine transferase